MTSIKTDIIRFLEANGHKSKSQICDHLRDTKGTMGETTGRRLRELINAGVVEKFQTQTPLLENPYTAYRVVKESTLCEKPHNNGRESCNECMAIKLGI